MSRPVLLYDGDRGFCTRSARLARRILPEDCTVASGHGGLRGAAPGVG